MRACCLLILLLGISLPGSGEDVSSMSSIFLVAKKDLRDPFFRNSVVLVTHRAGETPVGVIINRPMDVPLSKVIPDLERAHAREEKLYLGGPVSMKQLVVVFRAASRPKDSIELIEGVYLSWSREVLLELLRREKRVDGLRVYAGHSAWSPGQLEAEIGRGGWHLTRAEAAAIFDKKPENLWQELEKRAAAKQVKSRD